MSRYSRPEGASSRAAECNHLACDMWAFIDYFAVPFSSRFTVRVSAPKCFYIIWPLLTLGPWNIILLDYTLCSNVGNCSLKWIAHKARYNCQINTVAQSRTPVALFICYAHSNITFGSSLFFEFVGFMADYPDTSLQDTHGSTQGKSSIILQRNLLRIYLEHATSF